MKRYKLPTLSKYDKQLCMLFADNCVGTNISEYSRRNQYDINKVKSDIYNGKLAEVMVYTLLFGKKYKPYPIDFMIYKRYQKSFDADIFTQKGLKIHVKSCLDDSPFPNSWLFQPNDKLVENAGDDDFLALVVMRSKKPSYLYLTRAVAVEYGDPVKKSLNKKVVYEEGLHNELF